MSDTGWMCDHRWNPAFLLPGLLLLDVSGGRPAVPDARGGLWERILQEKVLLRVRLPVSSHRCCRVCGHRLPELRDKDSVSPVTRGLMWCRPCRPCRPRRPLSGWRTITFIISSNVRPWRRQRRSSVFGDGQLFNFWCHLRAADRLDTVVSGGAATLMPFCSKTLLWPRVCKEESAEKAFYLD